MFGFSLKKTTVRKAISSSANAEIESVNDGNNDKVTPEIITSIAGSHIVGENSVEKKELVIPLPKPFLLNSNPSDATTATDSDDDTAKQIIAGAITNSVQSNSTSKSFDVNIIVGSAIPTVAGNNGNSNRHVPILVASTNPELLGITDDVERFKKDISLRALDVSVKSDIYKSIPIEEFGAAALRGMGWKGPNKDEEEALNRLEKTRLPREKGLGVGASTKVELKKKAEDKIMNQQLVDGDIVWLRTVKYAGRRGKILNTSGVPGLNKIRVCLETDGLIVEVVKTDAVAVPTVDLQSEPYKQFVPPSNGSSSSNSSSSSSSNKKRDRSDSMDRYSSWMRKNIRVKIVSKKLGDDRYLQKATVTAVNKHDGTATLILDDGAYIANIKDRYLQTSLPSIEKECLILKGQHTNQTCILVEKIKNEDYAIVKLNRSSSNTIRISKDDIAEYVSR